MGHYGEKQILFRSGGSKVPLGLTFQVTDVKKPLVSFRRDREKQTNRQQREGRQTDKQSDVQKYEYE